MNNQKYERNRKLMAGWGIINAVLLIAYLLEVFKQTRTIGYFLVLAFIALAPYIGLHIYLRSHKDSDRLPQYAVWGYMFLYVFVLATGKTKLVFTYIFPMLALLILFHDRRLILRTGIVCIVLNLVVIALALHDGRITLENSIDAEIEIALLCLMFYFSYRVSGMFGDLELQNEEYNEELEDKSRQLSDMAVQTITTIANTIDAKDGYTEGHSHRVAQYSRALALKLGKSEEEADEIYNVALLHDIGKIGVPDSILNKPGKLTDEEFAMIRQHPSIGGKILQDVRSFPHLSIGAKYHHERFDGHGYPEGLAGMDIPEVARIICVADSFDAMNSNRVYRRHFTKEYIRSELEHCQGTQFDPKIANAMLELLDEGIIDAIDTRPERIQGEPAEYHGRERRNVNSQKVTKELETVSRRIGDLMNENEEHDILDVLGEEQSIQKFESAVADELTDGDGCLILMDIDNFSRLNHAYGFLCGDACLHVIAETLVSFENFLVCRYEGDSFLVYAKGIRTKEEATKMIEELRSKLRANLDAMEMLYGVTQSYGIALSSLNGRRFARLLACAEKALGHVKKSGKANYKIYQETGDEEILASEKDLDSISNMIEKEYSYNGAFDLEYGEFGRVYELIRNLGIRNAQTVQLVLFTILFNDDADMPISDRTMVMKYLESAINNTVRKVDVTARFSSTQRVVLFTNLRDEDKQMVVERIMKEFYRMIPDNKFRLVYVSRNINLKELEGRKN